MKLSLYLSAAWLLCGATMVVAAQQVRFASGSVTVALPDQFKATTVGEDLIATFGENGDHKLNFRLLQRAEQGLPADFAVGIVERYAKEHHLKVTRFDEGAYLTEEGPQVNQAGREVKITYWMIAVENCMVAMGMTAPVAASKERDDFLGKTFDVLVKGITCKP